MISAIFACKLREAITEQSRCRERAACALISHRCGSNNDHRDSLKFVQEVARFVTSRFFGGGEVDGGSEKLLSWQYWAHLYYSPLSLSDCSSTHIFKHTHTYRNIWTSAKQRGGPPFTISDWFRPRYEPNVCLLLNHTETFRVAETFFSWTAGRTSATSDFVLVAPLRY